MIAERKKYYPVIKALDWDWKELVLPLLSVWVWPWTNLCASESHLQKRADSQCHTEVTTINVLDVVELHSPTAMETRELIWIAKIIRKVGQWLWWRVLGLAQFWSLMTQNLYMWEWRGFNLTCGYNLNVTMQNTVDIDTQQKKVMLPSV